MARAVNSGKKVGYPTAEVKIITLPIDCNSRRNFPKPIESRSRKLIGGGGGGAALFPGLWNPPGRVWRKSCHTSHDAMRHSSAHPSGEKAKLIRNERNERTRQKTLIRSKTKL